ncbi:MAG: hypothetical protein PHY28_03920 [Dehalococcoidales bacterium]|nr:hypothetical protein [Dehalococcoidales bacterium]
MNDEVIDKKLFLQADERREANKQLWAKVMLTITDGELRLRHLRMKLTVNFWVIVGLSVIMFGVGIVLLLVPVFAFFRSGTDAVQSLVTAGFGIVDLATLFLSKPIERIQNVMCDMSQITLALNSFQSQVSLRLMEMDITDRKQIGEAAEKIGTITKNTIKFVQDYCEIKNPVNKEAVKDDK